ncbi:hypothetical protein M3Y98_00240600 [Aphelenchoides besseyi]|nr:hypothetical protein M3Y98_00240600 [Aphelenchoides besseyi]KAI6200670.1 hypothetical protein M3Y96_00758600 [Aphelenchoides besseyi]
MSFSIVAVPFLMFLCVVFNNVGVNSSQSPWVEEQLQQVNKRDGSYEWTDGIEEAEKRSPYASPLIRFGKRENMFRDIRNQLVTDPLIRFGKRSEKRLSASPLIRFGRAYRANGAPHIRFG